VAFKEASLPAFAEYSAQIVRNSKAFATALAAEGFRPVAGGSENHMVLLDLSTFDADLTGKQAQEVLDLAGITANRNTIPNDTRSPFVTSGLRVGTAAETTAGMGEGEFAQIAGLMARALRGRDDDAVVAGVRSEVAELCGRFNPYAGFTR
jgi:glycine hydroxymethyltransferase